MTPDVYERTSKRRFEGKESESRSVDVQVKKWRRQLHLYDPKTEDEMKELTQYLQSLTATVPIQVDKVEGEEEDIDMSLWDLLCNVFNKKTLNVRTQKVVNDPREGHALQHPPLMLHNTTIVPSSKIGTQEPQESLSRKLNETESKKTEICFQSDQSEGKYGIC